jgi:hypothetical protein
MLNIWYVSKYVAMPNKGTTGTRGFYLMNEMALMGNRVLIITSDSNLLASHPTLSASYEFQVDGELQICWIKTAKYTTAKSLRRIFSWINFEWRLLLLPKKNLIEPDIIIVSSLSLLTIVTGFYWKVRLRCPIVFEVRDIWPLTIVEEGFSKLNPFVLLCGLIEKMGYKYADSIVGTMPNLGEHVKNVLGFSKTTHCIPMGIDSTICCELEPLPKSLENDLIVPGKFIVAYVGTIGISNALQIFFECAEMMQGEEQIHFLVVGDGGLRNQYIARYGRLANLTFGPKVRKTMVQSILSKCDLLYFGVGKSKVWNFGQSLNKLIDYMLSGRPIVGSYEGYQSMINEADCGVFIPNNVKALQSCIIEYFEMQPQKRLEIGSRGKNWLLKNRQYRKLACDYIGILSDVVETFKSRRKI